MKKGRQNGIRENGVARKQNKNGLDTVHLGERMNKYRLVLTCPMQAMDNDWPDTRLGKTNSNWIKDISYDFVLVTS